MIPKITVRRKGDDIFLSIIGSYSSESLKELLTVVKQLFETSLRCAEPESELTFSLKTRGKVNLDKMANVEKKHGDQLCVPAACGGFEKGPQQKVVTLQGEPLVRPKHPGLILVKGGAL